ncbi:MAG TPA: glutamine-hydrolyzing GMP synthase [Bacteroidales bacterium]|nr:GMP synthase (glutamine-hydrolyzing) [Bacteroidales bacterium]HRC88586.1 glutamine-hydrolyzing GMP synthase [Bacteroidales bacterium]
MQGKILILDFGSQYTQLIARRVRELNVYCEIYPCNNFPEPDKTVQGVILSGSPFSVRDANAPRPDMKGIKGYLPVLGICYGAQYLVHYYGGEVLPSKNREYGRAFLNIIDERDSLLKGISSGTQVWMSHSDTITKIPDNYRIIASTAGINCGAYKIEGEPTWGIQFHPEVYHTEKGQNILDNFVKGICRCKGDWTPESFIESSIYFIRQKIAPEENVILGLSGGVDSTTVAVLLNNAIGRNLICIFVDNGLLRKNEYRIVLESYLEMGLNVRGIEASDIFLERLAGVSDPECKRKIIGSTFIEVFEKEAQKIKNVKWLAQGTIYPDVIESVSVSGPSAKIKSHHNVGGLPEKMNLKVIEPLQLLFKDEVRNVGKSLGLPDIILNRHPFPGPGLAIRILGEVTVEKLNMLRDADEIFNEALKKNNLYDKVWQAGVILLPVKSVGVMGDERTYENAALLRAVTSIDGMTADFSHLPYEFLGHVANEIINKVKGINRVVYDITSKPPSTIEWE